MQDSKAVTRMKGVGNILPEKECTREHNSD